MDFGFDGGTAIGALLVHGWGHESTPDAAIAPPEIPVCQFTIEGDLDDNCAVTIGDVEILACGWLEDSGCLFDLDGDVNGDCVVNMVDFSLIANHWMIDCAVVPVDLACVSI